MINAERWYGVGYSVLAACGVMLMNVAGIAASGPGALSDVAKRALSSDMTVATAAIGELRAQGQSGLDAFLKEAFPDADARNDGKVGVAEPQLTFNNGEECVQVTITKEAKVLNQIAGQYDASASRLFWYTDLHEALEQAKRENKPVLSLRMLGKLTDDLSCANSRFFRTVLYANKEVGDFLRDHYVMHWQSVRPVPIIEIDYGDGRRVRRTITGNSAHYILDQNGRMLDVLPGIYAPKTFLKKVQVLSEQAKSLSSLQDEEFYGCRRKWHQQQLEEMDAKLGKSKVAIVPVAAIDASVADATKAMRRTISKGKAEIGPTQAVLSKPGQIVAGSTRWSELAPEFSEDAVLDQGSVALIAAKNPQMAMQLSLSKALVETPMSRMVRNLSKSIAEDTAQNEYGLHRTVHNWVVQEQAPRDFDALNEKVYAELFLTPSTDPWLGLVPPDTYAALDNGGILAGGGSAAANAFKLQLHEAEKPAGH